MGKRFILILGIFLLLISISYNGFVTRVKENRLTQNYYSQSVAAPAPSVVAPLPIYDECSIPQYVDPNPPNPLTLQSDPRFDDVNGRYFVWYANTGVGLTGDINYYDLGPDLRFNTPDDGGKFLVLSQDPVNIEPVIHDGRIMWISRQGAVSRINECLIPNCAITLPNTLLTISPNSLYDVDFFNDLIVYTRALGGNTVGIYLYDTSSGTTTPIFTTGYSDEVEIDGNFVAFNRFTTAFWNNDIFAYDLQNNNLIQVTNSPINEVLPRLNLVGFGISLLSYYKLTTISFLINIINPAGAQSVNFPLATNGMGILGNIYIGPNTMEIFYGAPLQSPPNYMLLFEKISQTQHLTFRVPVSSSAYIVFPIDVFNRNVLFIQDSISGIPPRRVMISEC